MRNIVRHVERLLSMQLPPGQSAFLWGPRKTGKSTFLKEQFSGSVVYDFLKTDLFLEISRNPALMREQLAARRDEIADTPVILDEVQKVPHLMDEVHWMIENMGITFILCGSSARKLKRGQANLLGGRAWRFEMFPLTSVEVGLEDMDLTRVLGQGMVPLHYLQEPDYCGKSLKAYINDYLKEEVFAEGLTRNVPAFSRFFDAMGHSHGQLTNYSNIARDCGVSSKTVREYYQILVDTLLGSMVEPYSRKKNRDLISKAPKFYLFDVGVAGCVTRRRITEAKGEAFGEALEHFILMEFRAHRSYKELDYDIRFWRTRGGQEVDFVLGDGEVAVEVKGKTRLDSRDFHSLSVFLEDYSPRRAVIVCNESARRVHRGIEVIPWREFLRDLWDNQIID